MTTGVAIAVLASGGGSNLQALLEHLDTLGDRRAGRVVLVASDRAGAGALRRAAARSIPTTVLDEPTRGAGLAPLLHAHRIELVALAGYLRLVPNDVIREWRGRILNVHPALLPEFGGSGMYGRRVHEAVIASGARMSGATVHFVDERYDTGPIIAQWPVAVLPHDTPHELAERVLSAEHALYPRIVNAVAAGRIRLATDGTVSGAGALRDQSRDALTTDPLTALRSIDQILDRAAS